jgi:hypothetical protein
VTDRLITDRTMASYVVGLALDMSRKASVFQRIPSILSFVCNVLIMQREILKFNSCTQTHTHGQMILPKTVVSLLSSQSMG